MVAQESKANDGQAGNSPGWRFWPDYGAKAYFYTDTAGLAAIVAYENGSDRPVFHGSFPTPERRQRYIELWLGVLRQLAVLRVYRD